VSKAGVVGPPSPRSVNPGYSYCKYPKGFPIGSLRGGPFDSVAFSLPGGLLAEVADPVTRPVKGEPKGGSLHIFKVRGSRFLKGSCLTLSGSGYNVAFGPLGLLAVTNAGNDTVTLYSVTAAGKAHQISVLPTGKGPDAVAFGPTQSGGQALAVANGGDNTVSTFTVYGTVVAPAAGSPFPTVAGPDSVAFSPKGLLAVAGSTANLVDVYSVSYTGALSGVGAAHAGEPRSVAFSTTGKLLGSADTSDVSVFSVATSGLLAPAFTVPTGARSITFDHHAFLFALATGKGTEVYHYAFPPS
jgi:WD40 repeat protein